MFVSKVTACRQPLHLINFIDTKTCNIFNYCKLIFAKNGPMRKKWVIVIMMTKPEGSTEYKNARKDTKTELARQNGQEDHFYQVQRTSSIRIIAQQLIELPNTKSTNWSIYHWQNRISRKTRSTKSRHRFDSQTGSNTWRSQRNKKETL